MEAILWKQVKAVPDNCWRYLPWMIPLKEINVQMHRFIVTQRL